jgi:hypothetical protein
MLCLTAAEKVKVITNCDHLRALRQLMDQPRAPSGGPPEKPRRSIGFTPSRSTKLTALSLSKGLSRRFKVEESWPRYGRLRRKASKV